MQSAHWAREEECAFCQLHDMHCGDVVLEPLYLNRQWEVAVIDEIQVGLSVIVRAEISILLLGQSITTRNQSKENFSWRWN